MKRTSRRPEPSDGAKCPKTMQVRLSPEASEIVRRRAFDGKRTHPKQASLIIEKSENNHHEKSTLTGKS